MHIQLRLWSPGIIDETPAIGEPFWDPESSRLGVFNTSGVIEWGPRITNPLMQLNVNQGLSGFTTEGRPNDVVLDFGTAGEVKFRHRVTGDVFARIGTTGALFNSATVQGSTRLGFQNLLINSACQIRRGFGVAETITNRVNGSGNKSFVLAPNWQLWAKPGVTGILDGGFSNDVPFDHVRQSIEVVPTVNPVHAGLRTFLHSSTWIAGQRVTFSEWLKGPAGKTARVRAIYPGGLIEQLEVVGTGKWERHSFTMLMPPRSQMLNANFIAFDALYNPSGAADAPWRVACPQVNLGPNAIDYDLRPAEVEKSLLEGIYHETKVRLKRGESRELGWDLMPGFTEIEHNSTSTLPMTFTEKDHLGAWLNLSGEGNFTDWIRVRVAAMRLPYLEESTGS